MTIDRLFVLAKVLLAPAADIARLGRRWPLLAALIWIAAALARPLLAALIRIAGHCALLWVLAFSGHDKLPFLEIADGDTWRRASSAPAMESSPAVAASAIRTVPQLT